MNAVEKLRSFLPSEFNAWETNAVIRKPGEDITAEKIAAIADEIENTYMKLPVDADGVPIKPGDLIEHDYDEGKYQFTVETVIFDGDRWDLGFKGDTTEDCARVEYEHMHHVQPETVESVLEDFYFAIKSGERIQNTTIDEYADRIRALEGGE